MSNPLLADHLGYAKLMIRFPGFTLVYSRITPQVCVIQLKLPCGATVDNTIKVKKGRNQYNACVSLIKACLRKNYKGGPGKERRRQKRMTRIH